MSYRTRTATYADRVIAERLLYLLSFFVSDIFMVGRISYRTTTVTYRDRVIAVRLLYLLSLLCFRYIPGWQNVLQN